MLIADFFAEKIVEIGWLIKFLWLVAWHAHGRQRPAERRLNPASKITA